MFGFLQVWINKQIKTINYEIYKYKEIINKIHGGGGLINFPTRFLRWIKIDGDAEGDDGGDGDSGDDGGSTEIDYEAIYQFYKGKLIELLPEELIQNSIIPEHYADIELDYGDSPEYTDKFGIWYSDSNRYNLGIGDKELFCEINSSSFVINKRIYFGMFKNSENPDIT